MTRLTRGLIIGKRRRDNQHFLCRFPGSSLRPAKLRHCLSSTRPRLFQASYDADCHEDNIYEENVSDHQVQVNPLITKRKFF